jgi:peroxiredoxin
VAFVRLREIVSATLLTSLLMVGAGAVYSAGTPVKDFTLPSATDPGLLHLANFSGKVVLINFWRTSCSDSRREAPKLVSLYRKYHDQGMEIVGVSDDTSDSVAQIPTYIKQYGITWPIGLNDQGEFMRELYKPVDPGGTPSNFLVSRSGEVTALGKDLNDESWKKLESAVTRALADPAPSHPTIPQRQLSTAPPLSLPDLQGKTVKLENFAGKPLLVNFFTSASCDWTGAVVSKLYRDYSVRGLQVVGINLFDSDVSVRQCTAKYGAKYPVLKGDQATQMAWIGSNNGWATFFVTPDGKVLKKIVDSINNGIEEPVFTKYAEYLVAKR